MLAEPDFFLHEHKSMPDYDLWVLLRATLEELDEEGVSVWIWWMPKEWNTLAQSAARVGAMMPSVVGHRRIEEAIEEGKGVGDGVGESMDIDDEWEDC